MYYLKDKASRLGLPWNTLKDAVKGNPPNQCHFCGSGDAIIGSHVYLSDKTEYLRELGLDKFIIIIFGWCEGCWLGLCFDNRKTMLNHHVAKIIDKEVELMLDGSIAAKNHGGGLF